MAHTFSVGQTPHTLGGLLTSSVRLLFRTRPLMRIALFAMLPVIAVQMAATGAAVALVAGSTAVSDAAFAATASAIAAVIVTVATFVPYFVLPWMEGALAYRVIEEGLGRTTRGARASFAAVRRMWPALFTTGVLRRAAAALLLAIGPAVFRMATLAYTGDEAAGLAPDSLMAAVVLAVCSPLGLVAAVLLLRTVIDWSLRAPVAAAEDSGTFAALRRSAALVRGQRWRMFGRLVPLAVLEMLFVALPMLPVAAWLATPDAPGWLAPVSVAALVFGAIGWFFYAPFEAIFLTLNYLDLRVRRENLLGDLADSFAAGASSAEAVAAEAADDALASPATAAQRIIVLQRRLQHEAESCPLWVDLATAYRDVGALGAAADALERARMLPCAEPGLLLALAEVHRARRDAAAAQAALRAYMESAPGEAVVALRADARWRDMLDTTGGRDGA
jgi:hypothetical protein